MTNNTQIAKGTNLINGKEWYVRSKDTCGVSLTYNKSEAYKFASFCVPSFIEHEIILNNISVEFINI